MPPRRILITGANKGIGYAVARRCLLDYSDTHVILACRNQERAKQAMEKLIEEVNNTSIRTRLSTLPLDVSSDESVQNAKELLRGRALGEIPGSSSGTTIEGYLYAIVNNAGIGIKSSSIEEILNVNVYGCYRVDQAFIEFMNSGDRGKVIQSQYQQSQIHFSPNDIQIQVPIFKSRIVYVSSGAGPRCVQNSTPEMQKFFLNPNITWDEIHQFMQEKLINNKNLLNKTKSKSNNSSVTKSLLKKETGIGAMKGNIVHPIYSCSKALLNCYMVWRARNHRGILINSCSPGAVDTDFFNNSGGGKLGGQGSTSGSNDDLNNNTGGGNNNSIMNKLRNFSCMTCMMKRIILQSPDSGTKSTMLLLFDNNMIRDKDHVTGKFFHKSGREMRLDMYG